MKQTFKTYRAVALMLAGILTGLIGIFAVQKKHNKGVF